MEKYFATHIMENNDSGNLVNIPVSWFNFIIMMLVTPEKFDWASYFLKSPLWNIVCQNDKYK